MTPGCRVQLSTDAKLQRIDPLFDRSTGTVLSVCASVATVRWDVGRTADYGLDWLQVIPGKVEVPGQKQRLDTKFASRWK